MLTAFRKRASMDLGGSHVAHDAQGRSIGPVTQRMLAPDERVVG